MTKRALDALTATKSVVFQLARITERNRNAVRIAVAEKYPRTSSRAIYAAKPNRKNTTAMRALPRGKTAFRLESPGSMVALMIRSNERIAMNTPSHIGRNPVDGAKFVLPVIARRGICMDSMMIYPENSSRIMPVI
jgi:hypothetical protein